MPAQAADRKQETRERILASAARVIAEKGLSAPSVNEIMAGAGLTVGGFYAHFESKDALLAEALDALFAQRLAELLPLLPRGGAAERRRAAARGYLSRRHRDGQLALPRCPMPAVMSEIERAAPEIRAVVERYHARWVEALSEPDDPADRRRALAALALMTGALALARAIGATPFSDQLLAAARDAVE